MNIHFKIQAKNDIIVNGSNSLISTFFPDCLTRSESLKLLYRVFDCDTFLLPYKVQKLSKRSRRETTVKAV